MIVYFIIYINFVYLCSSIQIETSASTNVQADYQTMRDYGIDTTLLPIELYEYHYKDKFNYSLKSIKTETTLKKEYMTGIKSVQ